MRASAWSWGSSVSRCCVGRQLYPARAHPLLVLFLVFLDPGRA
jgi:hypothetical protein